MQNFLHCSVEVQHVIKELAGDNIEQSQFYVSISQINRNVIGILFEHYPRINDQIIDLYKLYHLAQRCGGFCTVFDQDSIIFAKSPLTSQQEEFITQFNLSEQLKQIYISYLLAYEQFTLSQKLTPQIIQFIRSISHSTPQIITQTTAIIYKSMEIPNRMQENLNLTANPIRNDFYNNIAIGTIPVLVCENFGVQAVTGTAKAPDQLIITEIQKTTNLTDLTNYAISHPTAFLQSGKLESILKSITANQFTPSELLLIIDPICPLIGYCNITEMSILGSKIEVLAEKICENSSTEPVLIEALIRFLASFISRNSFCLANLFTSLISTYYQQIEGFLIYFTKLKNLTNSDLYTFNAAVLLLRCFLVSQSKDRVVYLIIYVAEQLIGQIDGIKQFAFKTICRVIYELRECEMYDSVFVFYQLNQEVIDEQLK